MSSKEEFVLGTGQSSNAAITKDAPIKPSREEFVFNMEQHGLKKTAAMKDAPIK